jgi:ubiquinone/menaquinone biosynthesis C-methylase UbiE
MNLTLDTPSKSTPSNQWQGVWEKRHRQQHQALDLSALIALDGFDSGAGRIETADWQTYAHLIADKLGLQDGDSVYEVGCGAGAFLYALQATRQLTVGGLDYSAGLIEAAQTAMPEGDFSVAQAAALDKTTPYDVVIANSVFHYFDLPYAQQVLEAMLAKARVAVAVLDVPNASTQEACEALRRAAMTQAEYEEKYAGYAHTYYHKDWFMAFASQQADVFTSCIPNYAQRDFRFSVILKK